MDGFFHTVGYVVLLICVALGAGMIVGTCLKGWAAWLVSVFQHAKAVVKGEIAKVEDGIEGTIDATEDDIAEARAKAVRDIEDMAESIRRLLPGSTDASAKDAVTPTAKPGAIVEGAAAAPAPTSQSTDTIAATAAPAATQSSAPDATQPSALAVAQAAASAAAPSAPVHGQQTQSPVNA